MYEQYPPGILAKGLFVYFYIDAAYTAVFSVQGKSTSAFVSGMVTPI